MVHSLGQHMKLYTRHYLQSEFCTERFNASYATSLQIVSDELCLWKLIFQISVNNSMPSNILLKHTKNHLNYIGSWKMCIMMWRNSSVCDGIPNFKMINRVVNWKAVHLSPSKTYKLMQTAYENECFSRSAVMNWHKKYSDGRELTGKVNHPWEVVWMSWRMILSRSHYNKKGPVLNLVPTSNTETSTNMSEWFV